MTRARSSRSIASLRAYASWRWCWRAVAPARRYHAICTRCFVVQAATRAMWRSRVPASPWGDASLRRKLLTCGWWHGKYQKILLGGAAAPLPLDVILGSHAAGEIKVDNVIDLWQFRLGTKEAHFIGLSLR